jgi:lysophospholipase L1-like esterase
MPVYVETLGAAYAEAGRFSDAIAMAKKARELAATNDDPARLGEQNQELEALYREHKTYGQVVDLQIPADRAPFVQLYYYSQHENFLREASQQKVNLLFLGDSITEHWRYQGSNVWNRYYAPRHAANFGIGGESTWGVLWQVKQGELANLKPKVIVLLIGTNQTGTDSPDEIASDIEALVQEIRATCPESKVLLLALFPRNHAGDTPAQRESIKKINTTIAGMDDGKMIRFLNINDRFLGPDGKISASLMPDFLHPSEKGYQVFAEAMEPTLAEMLK